MKKKPLWKYALAFEGNAPNYYAITNGQWGAPTTAKVWDERVAKLVVKALNEAKFVYVPESKLDSSIGA